LFRFVSSLAFSFSWLFLCLLNPTLATTDLLKSLVPTRLNSPFHYVNRRRQINFTYGYLISGLIHVSNQARCKDGICKQQSHMHLQIGTPSRTR
jgi:hypothetical protein